MTTAQFIHSLQPLVPVSEHLVRSLLHLADRAVPAMPACPERDKCAAVQTLCREFLAYLADAGDGQPVVTGALANTLIDTGLLLLPYLPPDVQEGMDRFLDALITRARQADDRLWHDLTRGKRFPHD